MCSRSSWNSRLLVGFALCTLLEGSTPTAGLAVIRENTPGLLPLGHTLSMGTRACHSCFPLCMAELCGGEENGPTYAQELTKSLKKTDIHLTKVFNIVQSRVRHYAILYYPSPFYLSLWHQYGPLPTLSREKTTHRTHWLYVGTQTWRRGTQGGGVGAPYTF